MRNEFTLFIDYTDKCKTRITVYDFHDFSKSYFHNITQISFFEAIKKSLEQFKLDRNALLQSTKNA